MKYEFFLVKVKEYKTHYLVNLFLKRLIYFTLPYSILFKISNSFFRLPEGKFYLIYGFHEILLIITLIVFFFIEMKFFNSFHIKYELDSINRELSVFLGNKKVEKYNLENFVLVYQAKSLPYISNNDLLNVEINIKIQDVKVFLKLLEKSVSKVQGIENKVLLALS